MNKIMIPAVPSARYLAVFSLFFCLKIFEAVAFAFAAAEVEFEEAFAIINEMYPTRE